MPIYRLFVICITEKTTQVSIKKNGDVEVITSVFHFSIITKKHQFYTLSTSYTVGSKSLQLYIFQNSLLLGIPLLTPNAP